MTMAPRAAPQFFVDPIGTVCTIVADVEPTLTRQQIIAAIEEVAGNRASHRRLARALYENPTLLTSGVAEGPPMDDGLIRHLREDGAVRMAQPRCGSCGKPQRRMSKYNAEGVRICVTCDNRTAGRRAPCPCANCGKVLTPRNYDRDGGPRCEWCPPEPDVDHVEAICDAFVSVAVADRTALREVIIDCVRQPARRRQLAWDLQDNPALLTGRANSGSATVRRLVHALSVRGFDIAGLRCPFCGSSRRLESKREGQPCCHSCYHDSRRTPCAQCGNTLPIAARTHDGEPLCSSCTKQADFNHGTCSQCSEFKPIATHRGGHSICFGCREIPLALCSTCGMTRPCHFPDSTNPRCIYCARQARARPCFRCGEVRIVNRRDADENPLCASCSRRRESCGLCSRVLPVVARVGSESRCWNCVKKEPTLFRTCSDCGAFGRMRQAGRCDSCAATRKLSSILADSSGIVPDRLLPVQSALIASPGHSLFTWLKTPNATALLSQLAALPGPVNHAALDGLSPPKGVQWVRQMLVTHGVLPMRDENLCALERWLHIKLPEVADVNERRLVTRWVTWSHLRRLRSAKSPTSPSQSASIRNEVKSVVKLLRWLRDDRGATLDTCTQTDLDQWCLQGGHMPHRARGFVSWCVQRRHLSSVDIPPKPSREDRHLLDDDHRWAIARDLLQSDTAAVVDRVTGLLVLLYGQSTHRIAQLTVHDVLTTPEGVQLRLGAQPAVIPEPLADLLLQLVARRRGQAAVGHSDDHDWLFPGGHPGRPLHPQTLAARLRRRGVSVRDGRNTALMHLASTMPAKVVSDLLGISVEAAAVWSVFAGSGNAEYAADLASRPTTRS